MYTIEKILRSCEFKFEDKSEHILFIYCIELFKPSKKYSKIHECYASLFEGDL